MLRPGGRGGLPSSGRRLLHTRPGAGGGRIPGLRPTSLGLRCLLGAELCAALQQAGFVVCFVCKCEQSDPSQSCSSVLKVQKCVDSESARSPRALVQPPGALPGRTRTNFFSAVLEQPLTIDGNSTDILYLKKCT